MSTHIQWTDETWNPVVGCTKVSAGCKHCYAKTLHDNRHKAYQAGKLQNLPQYAEPFEKVQLMPLRLGAPFGWRKPRKVFVNSMSDLFHEDVPESYIKLVLSVAASCPEHTFQILTKRTARMADIVSRIKWKHGLQLFPLGEAMNLLHTYCMDDAGGKEADPGFVPENIWLGTSVEHQEAANERIRHLLRCPAAVRFLSCEPLLGPVDLVRAVGEPDEQDWDEVNLEDDMNDDAGEPEEFVEECEQECDWINFGNDLVKNREHTEWERHRRWRARRKKLLRELDWVIIGGESGHKPRPFVIQFARNIIGDCRSVGRDQNAEHAIKVFVKQLGSNPVDAGDVRCANCFYFRKDLDHTTPSLEHPVPIKLKDRMGGDPAEWPEDLRVREFPKPVARGPKPEAAHA